MPYRLHYDLAATAVHDAMPPEASEQLTLLLADVCDDPFGHSIPYDEDDNIIRMVITDHALAVIMIGDALKRITVLQISYLG